MSGEVLLFFFRAEDGIRDHCVTGVQTCALPISGEQAVDEVHRRAETVSHQVGTDWRLGFDGAAVDFVDSLLAGRQPRQDVQEAKRILQVPLAIYEAARTGRAVAPGSVT